MSTQKLWPRILLTSGPWPFGEIVGSYLGRAPIHGRVAAAALRRLRAAAKAAAAAWAAWWEPALPTVRTANAFMVIIVAPSSRLAAAAGHEKTGKCGSRLNRTNLTRQAIF